MRKDELDYPNEVYGLYNSNEGQILLLRTIIREIPDNRPVRRGYLIGKEVTSFEWNLTAFIRLGKRLHWSQLEKRDIIESLIKSERGV